MISQKPFLFHALSLENFMIHQNTRISLSEKPITLITGANGSGKTQILDALILALGHHPKRLKKGKVVNLIGPFGKESSIELTLKNPFFGKNRAIRVPDKDLLKMLEEDEVKVVVKIHPENGLDYFLSTSKKRHKVLRKDVRALFESLNIRAENKLAFTEEGTVNIFSDHSDKNKLDLLLETTGLTAYRDNLLETMETIEKASRAVEPLRRKLTVEREYLKSMEKARSILAQKAELVEKYNRLVIEEAWGRVVEIEKKWQEMDEKISRKKEEEKEIDEKLSKDREEMINREAALEKLVSQRDRLQREVEEVKGSLRMLDGENQSDRRTLRNHESKMEEWEQKKTKVLKQKMDVREIEEISKEIKGIQAHQSRLKRIMDTLDDGFFAQRLSYERELLSQSILYRNLLKKEGIEACGPLFDAMKMEDISKKDWETLLHLVHEYAFSFLVSEEEDFDRALGLWEKAFSQDAPPPIFLVFCPRLPKPKTKKERTVFGPLEKVLSKHPEALVSFLQNMMKVGICEGKGAYDAMKLAQEKGARILAGERFFLPWPAIGGAWRMELLPICFELSLEEIEEAFRANETYQELSSREKELQERLNAGEDEGQISFIDERIAELRLDIERLQEEIDENASKAAELSEKSEEAQGAYREIADALEKANERLRKIQERVSYQERQIESIQKIVSIWEEERTNLLERTEAESSLAREKGARPEEIRPADVVLQERVYLEGKLETLQASPISEEEFLAQQQKVAHLEAELSGSDGHLGNLKSDMQKRFEKWHEEVSEKIRGISDSMNELLRPIAQGVKITIDNLKTPENAGLRIEVQRQGNVWHDLVHLSGGEKVLTVESLILSLHLQTDSPIHAIDECTQRLDIQFKAMSFDIVQHAVAEISQKSRGPFSPQFILLAPDTLGVEFSPLVESYFKRIVLSTARLKSSPRRVSLMQE